MSLVCRRAHKKLGGDGCGDAVFLNVSFVQGRLWVEGIATIKAFMGVTELSLEGAGRTAILVIVLPDRTSGVEVSAAVTGKGPVGDAHQTPQLLDLGYLFLP